MQIRLAHIKDRQALRGSPTAPRSIEVWWEHEGDAYPGTGWRGIASVIPHWLPPVRDLLSHGAPAELRFLDGPCALYIARDGRDAVVRYRGESGSWRTPLADLAFEMVRAADLAAHRGYQKWHREYDRLIEDWIRGGKGLSRSRQEVIQYLRWLYSNPDMLSRFPDALEHIR